MKYDIVHKLNIKNPVKAVLDKNGYKCHFENLYQTINKTVHLHDCLKSSFKERYLIAQLLFYKNNWWFQAVRNNEQSLIACWTENMAEWLSGMVFLSKPRTSTLFQNARCTKYINFYNY